VSQALESENYQLKFVSERTSEAGRFFFCFKGRVGFTSPSVNTSSGKSQLHHIS